MWFRTVLFGLFCLGAVSYATSERNQNFDATSSISGGKRDEKLQSIGSEENFSEKLQNEKESSQESTTKKLEEKETPKPILDHESERPSDHSGIKEDESSNDRDTKYDSSKDRTGEKENKEKDEEDDVCFLHLGCFKMGKPWKSILRPIAAPDSPEEIQTTVHFYNRQSSEEPIYISVYPEINMKNANFDSAKKSVILVHGFGSTGNATWMKDIKNAYLKEEDVNMMLVDWGEGAKHMNYLQVAGNTRVVGKELALLVKSLVNSFGADLKKFHLIGHSLGAQICSYLAKEVPGIARLTALDPAQPGFEGFDKEVRLDRDDADFVDVIHTDAKPFIPTLGFGMIAPQGDVDFYVNGGYAQPGCILPEKSNITITGISDLAKYTIETLSGLVSCSHGKAHKYFLESLNKTDQCTFWGHKADPLNVFMSATNTLTQGLLKKITALSPNCSEEDCIPLGFDTDKSPLRGIFVVTTNKDEPYCISEVYESKVGKLFNFLKENSKLVEKIIP